jgi:hypothetical protein
VPLSSPSVKGSSKLLQQPAVTVTQGCDHVYTKMHLNQQLTYD